MTRASRTVGPVTAFGRRWSLTYVAGLLAVFVPLYVLTRPALLISDGGSWVLEASLADPSRTWYGFPTYFLQIPMAAGVWRVVHGLGSPISIERVYLSFSLAGTLAALIFVGLIAAEILRTNNSAWLAAILFGASLNPWTQWNGELSGLAVGFVAAGLFFALRGRIVLPAVLWALSVLSQINFVVAAPAFILAAWMSNKDVRPVGDTLRRAVSLLVLAGAIALLLFLVASRAVGKWNDVPGLVGWLSGSFRTVERNISSTPEVARAIKGLVTAYTAAGHSFRDLMTGRGAFDNPAFVPTVATGSVLLVATGILVFAGAWEPRLVLFALVWLLPFHVGFNWWWAPTEEEYHAAALPGFVLLITAGLVQLGSRMPARRRYALYVTYAAVLLGLNLFTAILPRRALAADMIKATRDIRQLNDERHGLAVLVTCDGGNVIAVQNAGIEYLRIRSIWRGSVPEIQNTILTWIQARMAEGKEPYVLERWCLPEYWKTEWSKAPFDLYFLERDFRLAPAAITAVPTDQPSVTDPFTWRRGDLVRLDLLNGTGR